MRFKGKVLFATGAGSGLAAATARRFTAEGGRVAVVDLDRERADAVASTLEGAIAVACDVSDQGAVHQAIAQTRDRLGRIDCVFNAAGHVLAGPIEDYALSDWNRMLAVHATGTFLVCQAVLPLMRATGGGSIVNTASVAALIARPNLAAYAAAKGAILAFSRQLALDAAASNVRVNVVAPGTVLTGMTEPFYRDRGGGDMQKGAAMTSDMSIQKRIAEPEEIAAPVCFYLSDEASFFTGSIFVPDGGFTAV